MLFLRASTRQDATAMNRRMDLDGVVAPGFDAVADAFERNFEDLGDIGAGASPPVHP